ncbi:MAG: hypothetical protein ACRDTC_01480 [Pseudonocardiaceae bacterium]
MTKDPETPHEPPQQSEPDNAEKPALNRRERRGGKSGVSSPRGGKSTVGRMDGALPNPRQYSTRRRGG